MPAFIPLSMREPGKGMKGEICWRRAGVRAGLGSYGQNGLLVTKEYGAAVRLSGVCTSAELIAEKTLAQDLCVHCLRCLEACPPKALLGDGKINKKLCGDDIFQHGFRYFQRFIEGLMGPPGDEIVDIVHGHGLRELWQTFMTGNYYYCFDCQAQCPAEKLSVGDFVNRIT